MRYLICALGLVLMLSSPFVSVSSWASPILFTDRAAFDAAAGPYINLTLDASELVNDPRFGGAYRISYGDGLLQVALDPVCGCSTDGELTLGIYEADAYVAQPLTAFGFDILGEIGDFVIGSPLYQRISVDGLTFLGFVYKEPFYVGFSNDLACPGLEGSCYFTIDNVAIQLASAVPEPTSWLLLSVAIVAFIGWQAWKRRTA